MGCNKDHCEIFGGQPLIQKLRKKFIFHPKMYLEGRITPEVQNRPIQTLKPTKPNKSYAEEGRDTGPDIGKEEHSAQIGICWARISSSPHRICGQIGFLFSKNRHSCARRSSAFLGQDESDGRVKVHQREPTYLHSLNFVRVMVELNTGPLAKFTSFQTRPYMKTQTLAQKKMKTQTFRIWE